MSLTKGTIYNEYIEKNLDSLDGIYIDKGDKNNE